MLRTLLPVLLCGLLAPNAMAASLAGMTLPDSYPVEGQTLVLNGIGLRTLTIFHIKAYVAGLYLVRPSHDAREILRSAESKVVILKFIRAASKERVETQYRAGEAANCGHGECAPSDQADFEKLIAAAPAVKPGDTFTYIFTNRRVRVFANDRVMGDFADRDLAYRLLSGFIGDHPPSADLRRQLLGLPEQ
jgi:hypothetical protein